MLPSNLFQEHIARRRGRTVTPSGAIIAWRGAYTRWCIFSPNGHFAGSTETYAEALTWANRTSWSARAT